MKKLEVCYEILLVLTEIFAISVPDPICYAYKDGSFSGCDDKTRSPFPGTCSTVDSVDGQRKDVCFCHTNICNKGTEVGKRTALQLVLTLPLARLFY